MYTDPPGFASREKEIFLLLDVPVFERMIRVANTARNETDPFAGIDYWIRALNQAQCVAEDSALPMKKFLVAARIDRGGISASRERIDEQVRKLGFDGYFETSSKEGWGIEPLIQAIQGAIDWKALPEVISTRLFQRIKNFLIMQKKAGRPLQLVNDLYYEFLRSGSPPTESKELRAQFETCIERLESQDLIRQFMLSYDDFTFNFLLLQPELLDVYASALINAVKDEPNGLGSIAEEKVRSGDFRMSEDERLADKKQEKWLLSVVIKDLLRYEIALLEKDDDDKQYLVFPSQVIRERSDLPDSQEKAIVFDFEGPVQNIYTTLAVRIARSNVFTLKGLWKNAVTYIAAHNGMPYRVREDEEYGMYLRNTGTGQGELTLFFGKATNEYLRLQFERYIHKHLSRWALPETIHRQRIFVCSECKLPFGQRHVIERRKRGFDWIQCNVCNTIISLLDGEERLMKAPPSLVPAMDHSADTQRELVTTFITQNLVKELKLTIGDEVQGNKPSYNFSGISNSNISGVAQGENNVILAKLDVSGKAELAEALKVLSTAVMSSQHLLKDEKEDQIDVINQIGEEASKPKPNKSLLKMLGNGLIATLKAIPDVAQAASAAVPILTDLDI